MTQAPLPVFKVVFQWFRDKTSQRLAADSTQLDPDKHTNSNWHYLYYLLAGFNLFTILVSLYLNHQITTTYTHSVKVNKAWGEQLQQYEKLEQLAASVNAPGNDVFISRNIAAESERLNVAVQLFDAEITKVKQSLHLHANPVQVEPLIENLNALDEAMKTMISEANLIFSDIEKDQPQIAGQRMAYMDQTYHHINQLLNNLRHNINTIQYQELIRQQDSLNTLRYCELAIAIVLTLMIASITLYGHKLACRMQISLKEREKAFKQLKQVEASLREQTEKLEYSFAELKTMQSRLVESEKMSALGVMVAGIAHEINNPINFIHGNLRHAEEYCKDLLSLVNLYQDQHYGPDSRIQDKIDEIDVEFIQEDFPKLLDSMQSGTARIREIVKSLRTFSRLDEAEFKEANLHEGINSTLLILNNRLKGRPGFNSINVVKHYGIIPFIDCYPGQLNQVFMNVLSNAIDALEECGKQKIQPTITIHTEVLENHSVCIRISDNGSGMPESIISKIFDPFFTTKSVGKGTGLGLSISYKIVVENHRGQIRCHSILGRGTEFIIEIPILQSSAYSTLYRL